MKATPIGMIELGAKVYVKPVNAFGVVEDNTNGNYLVVFGSDSLDEIFGIYERNDLRCY
jgi:hypothetical protein